MHPPLCSLRWLPAAKAMTGQGWLTPHPAIPELNDDNESCEGLGLKWDGSAEQLIWVALDWKRRSEPRRVKGPSTICTASSSPSRRPHRPGSFRHHNPKPLHHLVRAGPGPTCQYAH